MVSPFSSEGISQIIFGSTESNPPVGSPAQGTTEAGLTTKVTAPTNAATFEAIEKNVNPNQLTEVQLNFVVLLDMHWHMYGEVPTAERAKELYQLPLTRYAEFMTLEGVRAALVERGINIRLHDSVDSWQAHGLTPIQLLTANTMLDMVNNKSDAKKLQDLGISTTKWQAWLRDPVFSKYLSTKAEEMVGAHHHDAMIALIDRVRSGDTKAIELYLEFTGRFTRNSTGPQFDLPTLLTRVLEIIIDEISDLDVLNRISEKLMGLGQAHQISQALTTTTEPQLPQIMPARELSPELQEAVDHGAGVNI